MTTRKTEDKNIRKLARVGTTSIGVTLPIEMVKELGWKLKQNVVVKRIKGGMEIRDWRK